MADKETGLSAITGLLMGGHWGDPGEPPGCNALELGASRKAERQIPA